MVNKAVLFCLCPPGNVHYPPRTGSAAGVDAHRPGHVWRHVQLVLHADDGHPLRECWSHTANWNVSWRNLCCLRVPFEGFEPRRRGLGRGEMRCSWGYKQNQLVHNVLFFFLQDTTTIEKMAHFSNEMWVSLNHHHGLLRAMPTELAEGMQAPPSFHSECFDKIR